MTRDECKPGSGWDTSYPTPVYDHVSGLRVHAMGLLRLPSGDIINGGLYPESKVLSKFIRINGGNQKRGTMAWARSKMKGN